MITAYFYKLANLVSLHTAGNRDYTMIIVKKGTLIMEKLLLNLISVTYNIYKITYIYITVFSQWLVAKEGEAYNG